MGMIMKMIHLHIKIIGNNKEITLKINTNFIIPTIQIKRANFFNMNKGPFFKIRIIIII